MQRNRPVRSMLTVLRTVTAAVLLAAVGGAASHWATSGNSRDVTPTPTAFTQSLQATPFREFVTPDGRGGYPTAVAQVGKILAVSDTSLTAVSSDGTIRTYLITPRTTAVTVGPAHDGRASSQFNVNEIVSIVGTVEDGTAIASVLVDQALANGNGPPMDG